LGGSTVLGGGAMANPSKESGEFNLIITEVESARQEEAAGAFAQAFSLDETLAGQILKSAPIIFAGRLTKSEVKALTPKLTELSELGIEFRITARVAAKMPKVNWPVRPQFTAGGSGGPNGLAFEWDNNAFVCPGCGETFLFRRLGQLKLAEPTDAAPPSPPRTAMSATRMPPRPAPEPEVVGYAEEEAQDVSLQDADPEVSGVEGEPLPGDGETPLDLPGSVEEIPIDTPAEPVAGDEPEPETEAAVLPGGSAESGEEGAEEEANGELYNVFLSKIADRAKQDQVATLIAQLKGCPMSEAKELTGRLVIPIAKNVAREEAEQILEQFKKLKVVGRMTKVR
jgi:ribosomal protein L7/L12